MRFRDRIAQFMYRRNGYDAYSLFLLGVSVVLMLLTRLLIWVPVLPAVLQVGSWAALIYCIWRILSKNTYKRQQENARYYELQQAFFRWFRTLKERWQQRKEYKFFRCPSCHVLLRVPRGKGKLQLTCRKCGNRFERRS